MATSARLSGDSFTELDVIRLRSVVYTDRGMVPVGATGTILFRHAHGEAFEVEFAEPAATVLTLRPADMAHAA